MKGILSFLAVIASLIAAYFLADSGVNFMRKNHHKYITLKEDETKNKK
ncbi:MAG: hypothetical protein RSB78_06915 [Oscillospiraceae bacterium]